MKVLIALIWALLCLPVSLIMFYFLECFELAKIFSSKIAKTLGE